MDMPEFISTLYSRERH